LTSSNRPIVRRLPKKRPPLIRIGLVLIILILSIRFVLNLLNGSSQADLTPPLLPEPIAEPKRLFPLPENCQKIKRHETLSAILSKNGIPQNSIHAITHSFGAVYKSPVFIGQCYHLERQADSSLKSFTLRSKDLKTLYTVTRSSDSGYVSSKVDLPITILRQTLTGILKSSLYEAMAEAGEKPELIISLLEIFSWDINWFFDPRENDTFTIVFEKHFYNSEFIDYGPILAAYYNNAGTRYTAYHFGNDTLDHDYFNEEGVSLRKTFLKAPLTYRRISSGFSYSRMHPVLKYRRPHLGIDYAAPTGTPVKAASDGKVIYAKRKGGYGKCIKLNHNNLYYTHYGHLSRYARGIRSGKKVRQGDIIGYVGNTGLSTGPHLDYRVQRGKRFINPRTIKSSSVRKIPQGLMPDFEAVKLRMNALITGAMEAYASQPRSTAVN
jgi:murein DD-endopeptidase MepM/ murein hydrolase activator NlpD